MKHIRLGDYIDDIVPELAFMSVIAPWIAIIPLFWITPASEPEGNNRCTHWQECSEELKGEIPLPSPNQETDKYRTPTKQKRSSDIGDNNPNFTTP